MVWLRSAGQFVRLVGLEIPCLREVIKREGIRSRRFTKRTTISLRPRASSLIISCPMNLRTQLLAHTNRSSRPLEIIRASAKDQITHSIIKVKSHICSRIGQWYLLLASIQMMKEIVRVLSPWKRNLIRLDSAMEVTKPRKTILPTDWL